MKIRGFICGWCQSIRIKQLTCFIMYVEIGTTHVVVTITDDTNNRQSSYYKIRIRLFQIKAMMKSYWVFSQWTSVLSLLFKKGDPLVLDNYRPISLLNIDLKLLSFVLAQRLKKVWEKIVNNDQTGYIRNRFNSFNHRQIQDLIDFAKSYNVEGAIVCWYRISVWLTWMDIYLDNFKTFWV